MLLAKTVVEIKINAKTSDIKIKSFLSIFRDNTLTVLSFLLEE